MATFIETDWDQKRNEEVCKQIQVLWKDAGLSLDQETKKNGMGHSPTNLTGNGINSTAQEMMRTFAQSGDPA